MPATFPPPLISLLSLTLSMITHNWCVINCGTYRAEQFTGVELMHVDLDRTVMRLHNHVV